MGGVIITVGGSVVGIGTRHHTIRNMKMRSQGSLHSREKERKKKKVKKMLSRAWKMEEVLNRVGVKEEKRKKRNWLTKSFYVYFFVFLFFELIFGFFLFCFLA
jgi:hypothetical protein